MDRFIPCRMGENLQAKFEAVSQKYEEEVKYSNDRNLSMVHELGLNGDTEGNEIDPVISGANPTVSSQ